MPEPSPQATQVAPGTDADGSIEPNRSISIRAIVITVMVLLVAGSVYLVAQLCCTPSDDGDTDLALTTVTLPEPVRTVAATEPAAGVWERTDPAFGTPVYLGLEPTAAGYDVTIYADVWEACGLGEIAAGYTETSASFENGVLETVPTETNNCLFGGTVGSMPTDGLAFTVEYDPDRDVFVSQDGAVEWTRGGMTVGDLVLDVRAPTEEVGDQLNLNAADDSDYQCDVIGEWTDRDGESHDALRCFGSKTIQPDTPFNITHGWHIDLDRWDGDTAAAVQGEVDGGLLVELAIGDLVTVDPHIWVEEGGDSEDVLHFLWSFPDGLTGTHQFTVTWRQDGELAYQTVADVSFG